MDKIKFNKNAELVSTSDLYYDLFNGYFRELISNCDYKKEIKNAMEILENFLSQAEKQGYIELI